MNRHLQIVVYLGVLSSILVVVKGLTMCAPCNKQCFYRLLFLLFGIALFRAPAAHAISGGSNAIMLQGQVQLFEFTNGVATYQCTGSLIAPDWVLTAKHCITATGITALTGAVYVGSFKFGIGQSFFLENIYLNNNYDVALLQLRSSVTQPGLVVPYGTGVPPEGTASSPGAMIAIQGWGYTNRPPGTSHPSDLQSSVQIVDEAGAGTFGFESFIGVVEAGDSGAGMIYGGTVCGVFTSGYDDATGGFGVATDAVASYIKQVTGVPPAPNRPDGTHPCEPPEDPLPCDIEAESGTQCVAAYSTVRSLYASAAQNVRLYQVGRASDGKMFDILVGVGNSEGGNNYADAAAQDAFCTNTTCTITKIYDQSPFGNDLSIEGPGGNKKTPDIGAVANALPIMLNGHKVYGVSVTPGVGYRNNSTAGVVSNRGIQPGGQAPEGMYMVTSGTNVNGACCFDFGNAETNSNDNGPGHMDALNFGTFCGFPPCSGSGPWVEADLEDGQFMGNRNNPNNPSIRSNFVTATLKNNGLSNFALKSGDAQTGSLTTGYSGPLPTGYRMQQEGAIVLGTGGDNSAGGTGSFFEGAMTAGYPTDAADDAVQRNIVAAGYSGDSNPTNGEPPSYTGPSDPDGPGPQDDFGGQATEQPTDLMGSRPAMAYFNGKIYAAFQADDTSHKLFVTSTTNGTPYPPAQGYGEILMGGAPAMAEFRHELYIAFRANDNSHALFVTSSSTGFTFQKAAGYGNVQMGGDPAMAMFNSDLYVAFQANDNSHVLFVTHSPDGKTWPSATGIPNVQIGSAPAMAVFHSDLYVAFRANDASNDVWTARSTDGFHFNSYKLPGQHMGPNSSPALVVSNGVIYCIYGADDLGNEMLVMASTDGVTWQGPRAYLDVNMGAAGPAASVTGPGITVGFQSNDSRNVLFTTYKTTEADVYSGPAVPGSLFDSPASLEQSDNMGSKPALAFFNAANYAAFQANDGSDSLFVASGSPGGTFSPASRYGNISTGSAPAMAAWNDQLYVAFQANDDSHALFVTASSTGSGFPKAAAAGNIRIGSAPALAVFRNDLYAAFQANDDSHVLFVTSLSAGNSWQTAAAITNIRIGSAPALAVFDESLYVAFRADDGSNDVWIAYSSDGFHFSSYSLPGQKMNWNSSPALVVFNNALYCIYEADDFAGEMMVTATQDGSTWEEPGVYPNIQMGPEGPAATEYAVSPNGSAENFILTGFQSNDPRKVLFVTNSKKTVK